MDCVVPGVTKNLYFTIGLNFICLQHQGSVYVSLEAVSPHLIRDQSPVDL